MIWELVFMLVILKIPVVYLCAVVWWAIKAEPRPLQGVGRLVALDPGALDLGPSCDWRRRGRGAPRRPLPRGGRSAGARRRAQVAR
ncbi:MAG: hypothetical protein H0T61_06180 [Actinobacteria bacterium]|nr:hypothetical protein [Actinomycetota bacterium]